MTAARPVRRLLDTSAASALMAQAPAAQARLLGLPAASYVCICSITRGEILYGIDLLPDGRRKQALVDAAEDLFALLPCEPVPQAAGDEYAALKVAARATGVALSDNDLWIAATALALDAVLVSSDQDFGGLPAVRVEDWSR